MSILEARFPPSLSYGFRATVRWSTAINETAAGYETRNALQAQPRRRYEASKDLATKEAFQALRNFSLALKGAWQSIRFKDWSDFESDGAQVLGTGDGSETEFQLVKAYEVDSPLTAYSRTITKPVSGTVTVYLDDVEVAPADYTLDTTTGVITFDTPPGNGVEVTAEFEFDTPVRFESDEMVAELRAHDLFSLPDLAFIEVLGE
jgi:uncharacterized protein (TIGR02217 family)